ncbi:SSI family serine proteinase inhibitor [Streptacidiphilus neutrinimicus]|uniref:SSI family serine proteinase inhibitor n=1 Tax=Streptacidiphilus neutrinimicus TaxID=105420 RepID=UPI0005AB2C49|nr:SSI family serine proteinase inhibitor [Streptacidiphilus neutrinimicus]
MRHFSRRLAAAALVGAAVVTTAAVPQAFADTVSATGPSMLVMTVAGDGVPTARTAVLECGEQAGGDHPARAAACAALAADGLDFTAPPSTQVMCADVVQPVTVSATGVWNGNPVDYQRTYANPCLMHRATGPLFDF